MFMKLNITRIKIVIAAAILGSIIPCITFAISGFSLSYIQSPLGISSLHGSGSIPLPSWLSLTIFIWDNFGFVVTLFVFFVINLRVDISNHYLRVFLLLIISSTSGAVIGAAASIYVFVYHYQPSAFGYNLIFYLISPLFINGILSVILPGFVGTSLSYFYSKKHYSSLSSL
jgi:hypothetical protein